MNKIIKTLYEENMNFPVDSVEELLNVQLISNACTRIGESV